MTVGRSQGGAGASSASGNASAGSDLQRTPNPQVGASGQPNPSSAGDGAGSDGSDATGSGTQLTPEQEIELAKRDAQKLRVRLNQLEAEKTKAETDAKARELAAADAERLRAEIKTLTDALNSERESWKRERLGHEIEKAAVKLKVNDPEALAKLADWSAVQYDTDGKPSNAEAIARETVKRYPFLLAQVGGAASQDAGTSSARAPQGSNAEMNAFIRQARRR